MKTTHRSYDEEQGDFRRLGAFLTARDDDIRTYSTWCLGRLVDWKYGLYESKTAVPDFCRRNAHLWFDGFQELAGFAISESGDGNFAIITTAGTRFLFAEMLAWVLTHWGDRPPPLSIEITARQELEAGLLAASSFRRTATFTRQQFDLAAPLPDRPPLPDGFTIVDMATHPDYRGQRLLRADAFHSQATLSEAHLRRELLFYNHVHEGPIYHPEADLCVMAPDGALVAGCEALLDTRNAAADIERVCTHSQYRRRGLARAVIHACLERVQQMGMRTAYITGYSRAAMDLYDSLGATAAAAADVYQRSPA